MDKMRNFVSRRKYYLIGGAVVLIALIFALSGGKKQSEIYVVEPKDVTETVTLSGTVETTNRADLGFADSGRIARISVANNQNVRQGQMLAQLEIGELAADLRLKQIEAKTSDVDLEKARQEVERVTAQENTKVESARRTLLSGGLVFTPSSSTYSMGTPTVSGAYSGDEGTYKMIIDKENVTIDEYTLRTFGVEKTVTGISKEGPTKFGSKGLYVNFPDDLSSYTDTIWYLEIPNKAGSSYLANNNAYNEARENRDRAIKQAELDYQKLLTEKNGDESLVIQAEIDKINAEIRKNTIYAPFSGKVTNLEKEVGENAASGERVISMVGEERLEVKFQVSELDVSRLVPDSPVIITLDAFPGEEFTGVLRTVNSKETDVGGVPVYEAFVELSGDERIKNGMNAEGKVTLGERKGVLAVPARLISDGKVNILQENGKTEERTVTSGLKGTDGMVEIIGGLSAGEKIVPAKNE